MKSASCNDGEIADPRNYCSLSALVETGLSAATAENILLAAADYQITSVVFLA